MTFIVAMGTHGDTFVGIMSCQCVGGALLSLLTQPEVGVQALSWPLTSYGTLLGV